MQSSNSLPTSIESLGKFEDSVRRYYMCGVPVDGITLSQLLDWFVHGSAGPQTSYLCYVNAHVHNLARRDPHLKQILCRATICYADGMSILWAYRSLGYQIPERMTAADFLPRVLERMQQHQRRVYLFGGKPGVAEACAAELTRQVPGFRPAGWSQGYLKHEHMDSLIATIRQAKPDLLIVGLGTPRQEQWIARYASRLEVPLIWGVGALMDYFAGVEPRCPGWMSRNGLEWLFRFATQPRKMAWRYAIGNPLFIGAVLREHLKRIYRGTSDSARPTVP